MPLQLTTAFNPGDMDPDKTYAQVKIIGYSVNILDRSMSLFCQLGNTVNGAWTPSVVPVKTINLLSDKFLPLMLQAVVNGETVYNAVSRVLYQHLIDDGTYPGTIV